MNTDTPHYPKVIHFDNDHNTTMTAHIITQSCDVIAIITTLSLNHIKQICFLSYADKYRLVTSIVFCILASHKHQPERCAVPAYSTEQQKKHNENAMQF